MTISSRAIDRYAVALSALVLAALAVFLRYRAFDVDEFEHAHAAWSFSRGLVPYRDFFEHHTPALYFAFRPLFAALAPEIDSTRAVRALFACRTVMWLVAIATAALTARIARFWSGGYAAAAGGLAALLLVTSPQFANTMIEFRPDVPAAVLLTAAVACLFESDRDAKGESVLWYGAAGVLFGMSLMFTQKTLFAAPGLLFGAFVSRRRGAAMAFILGCALPIGATFAWFASHAAAAAFIDANIVRNATLTTDRASPLPRLLASAVANAPLYGAGVAGVIVALRERPSGPRAALLATVASLAAGVFVMARVYDQYYVLMLPLLAVLGANALAGLDRTGRVALSRSFVALAGVALALQIGIHAAAYQSNDPQLEDLRFVMDRTHPADTVMSGTSGAATFRPHAWYYFFLSGPFASDRDYEALRSALESGRIRPRLVIFDARVEALPGMVLDYLRAHYRPVRGEIYERTD